MPETTPSLRFIQDQSEYSQLLSHTAYAEAWIGITIVDV